MRAPFLILLALAAPACKKLEPTVTKEAQAQRDESRDRRLRQACASQASYDRLKALAFEKAEQVRAGNSATLDRLAASTVVRMENPVVKSRDEALNVTVCTGRIVIELPPGAEDAFDGDRRLTADVEYAAQAAADGSGLVYQLDGAEPIIYRLAAIDLKNATRMAAAAPAAPPTPVPTPEAQVAQRPARPPAPKMAAAPERPRPALARPSFNCRQARSRSERMVCSDERLAARDRVMSAQYYRAIADGDPETRAMLRQSRDRFLAFRERCGGPDCIAGAYEDRMDEIDAIAAGE